MASMLPISTFNLAIEPFSPVPAINEEYPITVRITLAAVDPESKDGEEVPSTLRILKKNESFEDESDEDDEDDEDDELDIDEESESKDEAEEEDDDEEAEENDDDEQSGSEDEEDDVNEFIICTLSPKVQFQQTIDITINPEEDVYFVVTGLYAIHLLGNYVEHPADETDSEDEYDQSPDEDEIIGESQYNLSDLEDESDIEGKIQELVEQEAEEDVEQEIPSTKKRASNEESPKAKKAAKKEAEKKSVQFTKELEQGPTGSSLTKKQKKEQAKQKKEEAEEKKEVAKDEAKENKKFPTKTLLGGVITEDRKAGKGPAAKSGNRVGIRYIGKLKNGKVFDKNTSGKPFQFGLGKGECIKGFDLGVAGMAVGGERRVVIPAKMGYGSQALPGIPANSELTFDIKLVSMK